MGCMNSRRLSRGVTVILFGILFASYIHHSEQHWTQLGLNAYLAHETLRFAKYPLSFVGLAFTFMIFILLVLWIYESIAWLAQKAWKSPQT